MAGFLHRLTACQVGDSFRKGSSFSVAADISTLNTTEPRGNVMEEFHVGFAGSGNQILPNTDAAEKGHKR
jgi:hypothetical protein